MKLTGGGNMYDQSIRNRQHYSNIHIQKYKLDTLMNLKLQFYLIVCIRKATKFIMIFPSQNDLNRALGVSVCQFIFLLNSL